jgi:hypothetical protein
MDLLTQVEGRVAKILGAVEAWAAELEADPAGVAPDELERRCRDLGLAVAHEVLTVLWARYGTGDQGARGAQRQQRHVARQTSSVGASTPLSNSNATLAKIRGASSFSRRSRGNVGGSS